MAKKALILLIFTYFSCLCLAQETDTIKVNTLCFKSVSYDKIHALERFMFRTLCPDTINTVRWDYIWEKENKYYALRYNPNDIRVIANGDVLENYFINNGCVRQFMKPGEIWTKITN
jgi:hypothetical protein